MKTARCLRGAALVILFTSLALANVSLKSISLPVGQVGSAYVATVKPTAGCKPYVWSVSSGSLPDGLALAPGTNGTVLGIVGTPTLAGSFPFTLSVRGCGGKSASASYSILVNGIAPPPSHTVSLSWTPPTTPYVFFSVYRGTVSGGPYTQIATDVASTGFVDSNVSAGATYYYVVTDTDNTSTESVASNQARATIPTP